MLTHRNIRVALALFSLLTACREKSRPVEDRPVTAATIPPGLTPLTSRDGSRASAPEGSPPRGDLPPGHPPIGLGAPAHPVMAGGESGSLSGTIEIGPKHRDTIKGGALFVIARNAASHQVAAVRREEPGPFPVRFELTAADVMMAGVTFEGPFDVTARWSKQGDAMPAAGDIEGTARGVQSGAKDVKLVLSDVRP
jgi:hypothetical protein